MPLSLQILYGVFFVLIGACVGSFLNVVIWRLPNRGREVIHLGKRGAMTLSWPPSHCPMCDAPIQWYQNIPVLSYVLLRGRCAKCGAAIPIRYPLVELGVAVIWGGLYVAYFAAHVQAHVFPWMHGAPILNVRADWPPYVVHAVFASALLAASAIDADLFIIPLSITWFLAALGVVSALLLGPPVIANTYAVVPQISFESWWLARPLVGAGVGLVLVNVLVMVGLIPRSFARQADVPGPGAEDKERPASGGSDGVVEPSKGKKPGSADEIPLAPPPKLTNYKPTVGVAIVILLLVLALWMAASPEAAAVATIAGGVLIFLLGVLPRDAGQLDVTDEVVEEISAPHVRREMLLEMLFLSVPVACASLAYMLPLDLPKEAWLSRLLGALMGMLVGGGVVWLVRIGGSIGFNKEAMGLGDVHLMAGVGAVIGAPLALVVFFTAPFLGIVWAIVLKIMGKPNVLPYGPWLSVASIMALVGGNPLICFYLTLLGVPC